MKPLLILPPSPVRWKPLEQLLAHEDGPWLEDLRIRLTEEMSGAQDAFAILPEGSHCLAGACIRRRDEIGVLGHVFTSPTHRQRGQARSLLQALLSWFDMSGGKWLYLTSSVEVAEYFFEKFGFQVLRHASGGEHPTVTMLRTPSHVPESPFEKLSNEAEIREASRADWALMVALMQYYAGADPRVPLVESALVAETAALDLITQQQAGNCHLMVAVRQKRVIGIGSIAIDQTGERTYAMTMPHDQQTNGLREALVDYARGRGYRQVDFPMEALAHLPGAPASATVENSTEG